MSRFPWPEDDPDPFNPANPDNGNIWNIFQDNAFEGDAFPVHNFNYMLNRAGSNLRQAFQFEILVGTENCGDLEKIDEHHLSHAWPTETYIQVRWAHWGQEESWPFEVLHRFEPICLRIQMLVRRTQARQCRWMPEGNNKVENDCVLQIVQQRLWTRNATQ